MALLEVESVSKSFGGLKALDNVAMSVEEGTITGLIGPNGAGKTTLFNVITNIEPADAGKVTFDSRDISRLKPYDFSKLGILRTFQRSMPFGGLTLLQNERGRVIGNGQAHSTYFHGRTDRICNRAQLRRSHEFVRRSICHQLRKNYCDGETSGCPEG